jgi:hypothetical protein
VIFQFFSHLHQIHWLMNIIIIKGNNILVRSIPQLHHPPQPLLHQRIRPLALEDAFLPQMESAVVEANQQSEMMNKCSKTDANWADCHCQVQQQQLMLKMDKTTFVVGIWPEAKILLWVRMNNFHRKR